MTAPAQPSPLFVDSFALCRWLIERLGADQRLLPAAVCGHALELLHAVTLALKARRREEQLDAADELLIRLRTELRLAAAAGYLTESQLSYALGQADSIGRQLGGWIKSLGAV